MSPHNVPKLNLIITFYEEIVFDFFVFACYVTKIISQARFHEITHVQNPHIIGLAVFSI